MSLSDFTKLAGSSMGLGNDLKPSISVIDDVLRKAYTLGIEDLTVTREEMGICAAFALYSTKDIVGANIESALKDNRIDKLLGVRLHEVT